MHEPAIAAASVVSSVTPVAAQKICAPTAAFRMRYPIAHIAHVMAPPSALPCSGRGENAPAAKHASAQQMSATSRASTSGSSSQFIANAASQLNSSVSPSPVRAAAAVRESIGNHFCSVFKKTPPAERMHHSIFLQGVNHSESSFTPRGPSAPRASALPFSFLSLSAWQPCAPALPWQPVPQRGHSWKWPTWQPGCEPDLR